MNSMKYKGYIARVEYDSKDRIFVGHLSGISDTVGDWGQVHNARSIFIFWWMFELSESGWSGLKDGQDGLSWLILLSWVS